MSDTYDYFTEILDGKKPAGYVSSITDEERIDAKRANLQIGVCQETGSSFPVTVIAHKGAAIDILARAPDTFSDFPFAHHLSSLIDQIKEMSIFEAILFLLPHKDYGRCPEIDVCVGLLFGYPPCCIRYFVEIRYLGVPYSREEDRSHTANAGRVLCKECRKAYSRT